MTTPFTRTASALAIVLIGYGVHVGLTAAQARRTDARLFISEMTVVGLTEVRLGQIAAERGERANVKAFGHMMVTDHTAEHEARDNLPAYETLEPTTEKEKLDIEMLEGETQHNGA